MHYVAYRGLIYSYLLCSTEEELRAMTRNVPGSIPGVTCIFFSYLGVWGVILVPCADLKFGIAITVGTPPAGRFGMLCSCILRSHATRTEGTFCSVAESCVLIFRNPACATFGVFVYRKFFCVMREGEVPGG